jgi:hypothetical protein
MTNTSGTMTSMKRISSQLTPFTSSAQAAAHRDEYGLNEVAHEKPPRWYVQLLHAFNNPFILLLLVLAVVSFLTGDLQATAIIAVMVLISVLLRFVQEYRSGRAAEQLKALVRTTATVSRPDPRTDVPAALTKAFGITRSDSRATRPRLGGGTGTGAVRRPILRWARFSRGYIMVPPFSCPLAARDWLGVRGEGWRAAGFIPAGTSPAARRTHVRLNESGW